MARIYYRPVLQSGPRQPPDAVRLGGGWTWFTHVERRRRDAPPDWIAAADLPPDIGDALTRPRADIAGLMMTCPRIMAILNVTPDSFSDGGRYDDTGRALARAHALTTAGADILDIGGESTRPGAERVAADAETARVLPVIAGLAGGPPISVDTRKASVATAALGAGAAMLNDVSAMRYDPAMAAVAAAAGTPICLMHSGGDPRTMQDSPAYDDVLLDVYDHLEERIDVAIAAGIARDRIVIDPGIGFGKTADHNLTLIANLSLFHALGCPILLGVSRKRFIGTIGDAPDAGDRMPGSVALALAGIAQGVQIVRVHDMKETKQAVALWMAAIGAGSGQ